MVKGVAALATREKENAIFWPWCAIFADDDGPSTTTTKSIIAFILISIFSSSSSLDVAGTREKVGRDTDAETSAEKSVDIQVVAAAKRSESTA